MIRTLLIGGRGNIGAGLRIYLPKLDPGYHFHSIDLPDAPDKGDGRAVLTEFLDFDIMQYPDRFREAARNKDLIVCLARHRGFTEPNALTDLVFDAVFDAAPDALLVASSSIHVADNLFHDFDDDGVYARIAARDPDILGNMPPLISAHTPVNPKTGYGRTKAYVERKCREAAQAGHMAVAARWGGINVDNTANKKEIGYFSIWCHQEDAARFVHACYTTHIAGKLSSGSPYFVVSANTHGIFDTNVAEEEIGYRPIHDAEETLG